MHVARGIGFSASNQDGREIHMQEPVLQIKSRNKNVRRHHTRANKGGPSTMGGFRIVEIIASGGSETTRLRVDLRARAARGQTATATRTTTPGSREPAKPRTHGYRHSAGMGVGRVRGERTRSRGLGRRRAHTSNMDDITACATIPGLQRPQRTKSAGSGAAQHTSGVPGVWATGRN